ncbi:TolC family protein, partial [Arthrospira platensis SPKY1]|nr:TolC family protein [Arthrospira platensis SPKY1]
TTNSSDAAVQRQQTEIEIDEVKKQIVNVYINILLLQESLKELQLGLIRLNDNKSLVEALFRHGVTDKSEVLRWKAMELQLLGKIESTRKDKTGMIRILEKLCHIGID